MEDIVDFVVGFVDFEDIAGFEDIVDLVDIADFEDIAVPDFVGMVDLFDFLGDSLDFED